MKKQSEKLLLSGTLSMFVLISVSLFVQQCTNKNTNINTSAWNIFDTKNNTKESINILLYYDMEGLSGQNILTSIDFPRDEYFEARELLTADVNAVIDGLFAGGADTVFVVDAHGSFNPDPDILLDKMDKRAKMLFKTEEFHPYVDLVNDNRYDAIVTVGMHSKTGGGGFAEHTINVGMDWILNGKSLTETEILAFSWGRKGVPIIFVSGDDKLKEQLSWMNWLEYVTTKKAKGIADAELLPIELVHKELRLGAKKSVEKIDSKKSVVLSMPIKAQLRVEPPADISILDGVPGINFTNDTVSFQAANFIEAYEGMRSLMNVAQSGYNNIAAELYMGQGMESFVNFKNRAFEIWQETANNRGKKQKDILQSQPKSKTLYFGSR